MAIIRAAVCASSVLAVALLSAGNTAIYAHDSQMSHSAHAHANAAGEPGDPKKVARTVEVTMSDDMKFTPARIEVKRGQTVRFVLKNAGRLTHEMMIGSGAELREHAEMMRSMPGMKHDEPNAASVAPGRTGTLIWRFTRGGVVDFACLEPGHFEAGMKGEVSVK